MSVSQEQAEAVARNWLNGSPMSIKSLDTSTSIREIIHLQGEEHGQYGYYLVILEPQGWLVIPAEDSYEPILAFGSNHVTIDTWKSSILNALIEINPVIIPKSQARTLTTSTFPSDSLKARRWARFLKSNNLELVSEVLRTGQR
jgi:hypothetical protein